MRDEARGDGELVLAVRAGEREAFGTLVERWFDRCWEVAWRILHDHGLAADVAQDTLFVAWRQLDRLDQPGSFGGWVLRISRNRALDRLERERRTMSTGDDEVLDGARGAAPPAGSPAPASGSPDDEVIRAGQQELLWAAAAALGERDASLLDLHLRHGLEPTELAEELGITPNAAHQALFRLRNRLGDAVRAWLLWRGGEPACVVLQAELAAAGLSSFDGRVVRLVTNHAEACVACSEERSRVTAPAALFGAVPLVLAPTLARAQALDALLAAGVPVPGQGPRRGPDPPLPGRRRSVWERARMPVAALLLLLLLGGSLRWGPGVPEPMAPVADAGAHEAAAIPNGDAVAGTEAVPADPNPSEDDRLIDGSVPDLVPAPLPPPVAEEDPADGTVERPPTEVTPTAEPPATEEPREPREPREPPEEGTTEEVDEEGAATEEPREEPLEPEEPVTDPPTIVRFDLTDLEATCEGGGRTTYRYWRVEWRTEDATSVHLDLGDGGEPLAVDPTGMLGRVCLPYAATVELTAANEGGTVSASEEAR